MQIRYKVGFPLHMIGSDNVRKIIDFLLVGCCDGGVLGIWVEHGHSTGGGAEK